MSYRERIEREWSTEAQCIRDRLTRAERTCWKPGCQTRPNYLAADSSWPPRACFTCSAHAKQRPLRDCVVVPIDVVLDDVEGWLCHFTENVGGCIDAVRRLLRSQGAA